ncbi:MAG: hypothetical protein RBJ76_00835 [Stenomitos frigidus ULC029]
MPPIFRQQRFSQRKASSRSFWCASTGKGLERDLAYALRTWQKAGLALQLMALGDRTQPQALTLPRMGWLTGLWVRLRAWFGLRRNQAGGFGSFVPESSSG